MEQGKAGYCVYRNVLVKWDEDYDRRIFCVIDQMPNDMRANLTIAQEHENCLSLVWRWGVPDNYRTGDRLTLPNGDCFLIYDSRVIGTPSQDYWKQFKPEEESWNIQ